MENMWTNNALISMSIDGAMRSNDGVIFTVCKRIVALWRDDHLLPASLVLILTIRDLLWPVFGKRIILQRKVNTVSRYFTDLGQRSTNKASKGLSTKNKQKKINYDLKDTKLLTRQFTFCIYSLF